MIEAGASTVNIEKAKGKWIMTLGSDTIVQKDSIKELLSKAKTKNKILEKISFSKTIFAPQLVSKNGSVLLSCRKIPTFWNMTKYILYSFIIRHINPTNSFWGEYRMVDWDHNTERFVEQPEATCWMGQKAFFKSIGGLFDEDFPLYFNDVETSIRVKKAGGRFLFCPDAEIIHLGGQSTKRWNDKRLWLFREGLLRLYSKHYINVWYDWISYYIIDFVSWIWANVKNITKSQNSTYQIDKLK